MATDSAIVANYFIQRSFDTAIPLGLVKVLKLVYLAQGWHRGFYDANLISDCAQAWEHGPIIPALFRKLRHIGPNVIDSPLKGYGALHEESTIALLDEVWRVYSTFTAWQLSAITHKSRSPWEVTWELHGGGAYRGGIIPNTLLGEYYGSRLKG
jgi:uncharacterized phage-associated protein